jgi:hypothetical protein
VNAVVSSHVSQVFHGVGPPAQLRSVPLRLSRDSSNRPSRVSNSSVVVPPAACAS